MALGFRVKGGLLGWPLNLLNKCVYVPNEEKDPKKPAELKVCEFRRQGLEATTFSYGRELLLVPGDART